MVPENIDGHRADALRMCLVRRNGTCGICVTAPSISKGCEHGGEWVLSVVLTGIMKTLKTFTVRFRRTWRRRLELVAKQQGSSTKNSLRSSITLASSRKQNGFESV
jgi:hypothetical protein